MIKSISRRFNASTLIAVIALVFAMTGGAYAAKKYLITSTGQISPKVLKTLKGAKGGNGANGAQGPAGAAGPQGPAGPAGPGGAAGAKGETGAPGKDGKDGAKGNEGSPWTAGGTLPSGKTETGSWAISQEGEGNAFTSISFPIPLAEALEGAEPGEEGNHVFWDRVWEEGGLEEEFVEKCPGSTETPLATRGNLCVYTSVANGLVPLGVFEPFAPGVKGSGTTGALLRLLPPEGGGSGAAAGDWAVTAP